MKQQFVLNAYIYQSQLFKVPSPLTSVSFDINIFGFLKCLHFVKKKNYLKPQNIRNLDILKAHIDSHTILLLIRHKLLALVNEFCPKELKFVYVNKHEDVEK